MVRVDYLRTIKDLGFIEQCFDILNVLAVVLHTKIYVLEVRLLNTLYFGGVNRCYFIVFTYNFIDRSVVCLEYSLNILAVCVFKCKRNCDVPENKASLSNKENQSKTVTPMDVTCRSGVE